MDIAILIALDFSEEKVESFRARGQEYLLDELSGADQFDLSLRSLAGLLVRLPIVDLAVLAAVESA